MSNRPPWLPGRQSQATSSGGPQPARAAFVPQGTSTFQSPWKQPNTKQQTQQQTSGDQSPIQPVSEDQPNVTAHQTSWQPAQAFQHPPVWPVHAGHQDGTQPSMPPAINPAWQQAPSQQMPIQSPTSQNTHGWASSIQPESTMQLHSNHQDASSGTTHENGNSSIVRQHADVAAPHTMAPAAPIAPAHQQDSATGSAAAAMDISSPAFNAAARLRDLHSEIAALQVLRMEGTLSIAIFF